MGCGKVIFTSNLLANMFSQHYALYYPNLKGIITSEASISEANFDENDYRGWGQKGYSCQLQVLNNFDWSFSIEQAKAITTTYTALTQDLNPCVAEGETGDALQIQYGDINLNAEIQVFVNQLNYEGTQFEKAFAYLGSQKNKKPQTINHTGLPMIELSGQAQRVYAFNKPLVMEGIGYNVINDSDTVVAASTVPDTDTLTAALSVWLRNETNQSLPRKANTLGGSITHTTPAANPRIDAIVAYETSVDQCNVPIGVVEGAELAIPTAPTDNDIQTALDLLTGITNVRWCRIANVYVEVVPTIAPADITLATHSGITYYQTVLALPEQSKQDTYLIFDYAVCMYTNGLYKDSTTNVTTENATALTLSGATTDMYEVLYSIENVDKDIINPYIIQP